MEQEERSRRRLLHHLHASRIAGRLIPLTFAVFFITVIGVGYPIIHDWKTQMARSEQGIPLLTELGNSSSPVIFTHEYVNTQADYFRIANTTRETSSPLGDALAHIIPYVPVAKINGTDPVPEDIRNRSLAFFNKVALAGLPLLANLGIYLYHVFRNESVSYNSYCANCKHGIVYHLDTEHDWWTCRKRVRNRRPEEEDHPNSWLNRHLPRMEDCDCQEFNLLDNALIKSGKVKVRKIPPVMFLMFLILAIVGAINAVVTPLLKQMGEQQAALNATSSANATGNAILHLMVAIGQP